MKTPTVKDPSGWNGLPLLERQRRIKLCEKAVTKEERQAIHRMRDSLLPTADSIIVHAGGAFWPTKLREIAADAEIIAAGIERSQLICDTGTVPGAPAPVEAVAFSG